MSTYIDALFTPIHSTASAQSPNNGGRMTSGCSSLLSRQLSADVVEKTPRSLCDQRRQRQNVLEQNWPSKKRKNKSRVSRTAVLCTTGTGPSRRGLLCVFFRREQPVCQLQRTQPLLVYLQTFPNLVVWDFASCQSSPTTAGRRPGCAIRSSRSLPTSTTTPSGSRVRWCPTMTPPYSSPTPA